MYHDPNWQMAKLIMLIVILLLMALCSEFLCPSQGVAQIPDPKWWGAICQVNYDNECLTTGFFVSKDGIIVTPLHLFRGGWIEVAKDQIWVRVNIGRSDEAGYKARVIAWRDKGIDILFLKIDYRPKFWFDKFAIPKAGMNCIALGYPLDWEGILEAKIIENRQYHVLGLNQASFSGASGSVVLDYEGRILGMVIKQYGYLVITHSHFIKSGLQKIKDANLHK